MSHLGTGSCAAPGSQALSLNVWTDTSGEQQYLLATPYLPGSHQNKSGDSRATICGARRPGFQTWFTVLPARSSCWPFPSRNHKGTSHLNYPQLDSSLCPKRSVTLSGNSTSTPSSPSQTPGSHQRCIYLTLTTPHIQSITTAQSLHLTAAPGQSSPSSHAPITTSLSQIVQQLCQTPTSIL